MGGATCLTLSNAASLASCLFRRVKDRHNLLHDSPRLKNNCVRQVVLDKWFPLEEGQELLAVVGGEGGGVEHNGDARQGVLHVGGVHLSLLCYSDVFMVIYLV